MKATILACIAVAALAQTVSHAQSAPPTATDRVTINGWALNMSNIATGANQSIRINIDRWSNASQRERFLRELENYSSEPVRLNNLSLEVRK